MRTYVLRTAAFVALAITLAGCSGESGPPVAVADAVSGTTTSVAHSAGSSPATELDKALAYSKCMRTHGVSNWPDPVETPSGGYGFRTDGVDPKSPAFQSALDACKALYDWGGSSESLSPAQQQAWLDWAKCIRSHGVPSFPDPTFSGSEVHISRGGSSSAQLQSAMDACKSHMPSAGGLGG
jgi:hypothetical protein